MKSCPIRRGYSRLGKLAPLKKVVDFRRDFFSREKEAVVAVSLLRFSISILLRWLRSRRRARLVKPKTTLLEPKLCENYKSLCLTFDDYASSKAYTLESLGTSRKQTSPPLTRPHSITPKIYNTFSMSPYLPNFETRRHYPRKLQDRSVVMNYTMRFDLRNMVCPKSNWITLSEKDTLHLWTLSEI